MTQQSRHESGPAASSVAADASGHVHPAGDASFAVRRGSGLEIGFLGLVWVLAGALLWHGLSLDLWRDDTIGPGAYPVFALASLLAITTALIARALSARELRLFSPFAAGLHDDSRLRQFAAAMSERAGIRIRVVTQDGEGRFSALWAGIRAGRTGDALTVVASDLTSLPNFHAAAFCHGRLEPIGGLFFDPDLLVVAADSEWRDPDGFRASTRLLRLGFGYHRDVDHAIDRWLAATQGFRFETTCDDDPSNLLAALRAGELDAVVLRKSQAARTLAAGTARSIAVFSDTCLLADAEFAGIAGFATSGPPVASGQWAALMVPSAMAPQNKATLEAVYAETMSDLQPAFGSDGSGHDWRYMAGNDMRDLIEIQRRCRDRFVQQTADGKLPRGKVIGLIAAIAGLALFPFVMTALGYVITAFCYVAGLMLLLWPRLSAARAVLSVVSAAGLSVGTFLLFTKVFSILLPGPAFLEGLFP